MRRSRRRARRRGAGPYPQSGYRGHGYGPARAQRPGRHAADSQTLSRNRILAFTGIDEKADPSDVRGGLARIHSQDGQPGNIQAALRALSQHKSHFTTKVGEVLFAQLRHGKENVSTGADSGRLTPREREVVQLIAEGESTKEVGTTLGISAKTAETHRATIMKKLDLDGIASLVRYAIRNHIIAACSSDEAAPSRSRRGVSVKRFDFHIRLGLDAAPTPKWPIQFAATFPGSM